MILRPTNVFDPDYYRLLTIWDAQTAAVTTNRLARENWPGIADNWVRKAIQDRAVGKLIDAPPVPPMMTLVSDEGVVSHVAFADLVVPTLPTISSTPNTGGFFFGGAPGAAVAADRTDQILAMLRAIASKLGITGA